ncbi:ABC transporter permease subunit [Kitasatospora sp. NPDC093102]|uniref:ABC transporter permease subunit n=1 Tax=Kitasatospora sp. NPDC093102 TaxID=3155069 RepID=UPI0034302174
MTLLKSAPGLSRGSLPARTASRLGGRLWVDLVVAAAVLVLLYLALRLGRGGSVRFSTARDAAVDTDPARLPAGAMAVPADLREAMDDLGVRGLQRWRRLIIPGIFPAYVTGGITASGGAWNASIVAEVVTFGGTTLTATGLGAYIARAAEHGDHPHLLAGVAVMTLYVVALNRLLWRRLYRLAERRYSL